MLKPAEDPGPLRGEAKRGRGRWRPVEGAVLLTLSRPRGAAAPGISHQSCREDPKGRMVDPCPLRDTPTEQASVKTHPRTWRGK